MGTPGSEEFSVSRPHSADFETQTNPEEFFSSEGLLDSEGHSNSEEPLDSEEFPDSTEQAKKFSERRRWPRFPDKERSGIWFSTPTRGAQHGRLEDIALGGLCVCVAHAYELEVGQQVVVGIGNWMIPAKISNMIAGDNKSYRIGMEWVRPESPAIAGLVERCCPDDEMLDEEPA